MTHDAEIHDMLPPWRWTLPLAVLAWALIVGGVWWVAGVVG